MLDSFFGEPILFYVCVQCRCDRYHLCGGKQQLQHGDQRRQSDQQTTGSSQPFQEHLEQQVSINILTYPQNMWQLKHQTWSCLLVVCFFTDVSKVYLKRSKLVKPAISKPILNAINPSTQYINNTCTWNVHASPLWSFIRLIKLHRINQTIPCLYSHEPRPITNIWRTKTMLNR